MKLHLRLDLSGAIGKDDNEVQPLLDNRAKDIGEAFFDAYVDSIDYEGETVEEALAEVKGVFAGAYGKLAPGVCGCLEEEGGAIASALFAVERGDGIFIPYVITTKKQAGKGYATRLIRRAIFRAQDGGYRFIDLFVTKGNSRAEDLYRRIGFENFPPEAKAGEA